MVRVTLRITRGSSLDCWSRSEAVEVLYDNNTTTTTNLRCKSFKRTQVVLLNNAVELPLEIFDYRLTTKIIIRSITLFLIWLWSDFFVFGQDPLSCFSWWPFGSFTLFVCFDHTYHVWIDDAHVCWVSKVFRDERESPLKRTCGSWEGRICILDDLAPFEGRAKLTELTVLNDRYRALDRARQSIISTLPFDRHSF